MTESALEIKRVLCCSEEEAEARAPVVREDCEISLESLAGARLERGIIIEEESHEPKS